MTLMAETADALMRLGRSGSENSRVPLSCTIVPLAVLVWTINWPFEEINPPSVRVPSSVQFVGLAVMAIGATSQKSVTQAPEICLRDSPPGGGRAALLKKRPAAWAPKLHRRQ